MKQNIKQLIKCYWKLEGKMEILIYAVAFGIFTLLSQIVLTTNMPGVVHQTLMYSICMPLSFLLVHGIRCVNFEFFNAFPSNVRSRFLANAVITHLYIVVITFINVLYYLIGCGLFHLQDKLFHNINASYVFNGTYLLQSIVDMLALFLAAYSVFALVNVIFARIKPVYFYLLTGMVVAAVGLALRIKTKWISDTIEYLWYENHAMLLMILFMIWILGMLLCWMIVKTYKKCPSSWNAKHLIVPCVICYVGFMSMLFVSIEHIVSTQATSDTKVDFKVLPYHFEKTIEFSDMEQNYFDIFGALCWGEWNIKDEYRPLLSFKTYGYGEYSMDYFVNNSSIEILSESEARQSDDPHLNKVKVKDGSCFICYSAEPETFMGEQFMETYFQQMKDTLHYDEKLKKLSYTMKKPIVLFTPLGSVNRYKDNAWSRDSSFPLGYNQIFVVLSDKDYAYYEEYVGEEE